MPQNNIPASPDVAAMQAAAAPGAQPQPVQVHQGAPAGIPAHPAVMQQRVAAAPPQADPTDFFAQVAMGDDEHYAPDLTPVPSASQPGEIPVDDLLTGGSTPEPIAPVQTADLTPQPQQQPQQLPPQQQPQQPVQAPTPEQLQAQAIEFLRGNTYRFNDEQARQALTSPEVALPDLAARLHVNIVTEMAQQIRHIVPMIVEQQVRSRTAQMEARNEFFRHYPKLNRPEWEGVIAESITMARQLKPNATRQELMAEGAALAAYRIRSQAPRPPAQGRPQHFTPAVPGTGSAIVPTNPQQQNPWSELAMDPDIFGV